MKYLIRVFLFNVFALWLTSQLLPALVFTGDWRMVLFAGFVLSILMVFVKPLLKILFLPVNILTLGLMSWAVNVVVIFLLTFIVPEVRITDWNFPGVVWNGFVVPPFQISYILSLVLVTFLITFFANFLHDVSEG